MARQFNGSTQGLDCAGLNLTSVGTGDITIAFWLWQNAFDSGDELALEHSANYNSNNGTFIVDPNDGSGANRFGFAHQSGGLYRSVYFTQPSAAAWHHYMLIISTTGAGNCAAYVDGSAVGLTTRVNTGGGSWGNYDFFVMNRGAASLWNAGRMAGLGIWGSALTSGNATSLAGGAAPSSVGSPLYAWNLCGVASPETASAGAVNLTLVGTPPQVADPGAFASVCSGGGGGSNWGPMLSTSLNRIVQV